ncbi:MAG: 1-(5-phosphoribosyl)-5-[(5-phosphoribosylamino)methylideneamino]imidazole-4-carboxamide isomerase [Bacteroidia bacterium]|nr:1-(5-phosphoribosyl)-5-[(5-phosphoribosylamino)methylideneamino]imidazole-4-carboxamide isomerase [Bacteroidia bacterium]
MRIIPAIDIIEGKCVRLQEGDYTRKKVYEAHPVEVARLWEDTGGEYLHVVDLDGAKAGKLVNYPIIEEICAATRLKVDVGGGIKSDNDLNKAFDSGAVQVNIGSLAVTNRDLFTSWIIRFGGEKILLSADVWQGYVAISGWQTITGWRLKEFISEYLKAGITTVVCTDISKDGMMAGPSFDLYEELMTSFPDIKLVASGGVTSVEEVAKLATMGIDGVIIGKAIYEGKIKLEDLVHK